MQINPANFPATKICHFKLEVNNNNYYVLPPGSLVQPAVWRPGTALDLASQWPGTRDEPLSMHGGMRHMR